MYALPSLLATAAPVSGVSLAHALSGRPPWARALTIAPFVNGDRSLSRLTASQGALFAKVCVPYIYRGVRITEDEHLLALVLAGAVPFAKAGHPAHRLPLALPPPAMPIIPTIETIDRVIAAAGVDVVFDRLTVAAQP